MVILKSITIEGNLQKKFHTLKKTPEPLRFKGSGVIALYDIFRFQPCGTSFYLFGLEVYHL